MADVALNIPEPLSFFKSLLSFVEANLTFFLCLWTATVLFRFSITRPLLAFFFIAWSLFFGFFPYAFKCALFYDWIHMCFPRMFYSILSLLLWVFALFCVNLDAGIVEGIMDMNRKKDRVVRGVKRVFK
jgi:hypothetical protein